MGSMFDPRVGRYRSTQASNAVSSDGLTDTTQALSQNPERAAIVLTASGDMTGTDTAIFVHVMESNRQFPIASVSLYNPFVILRREDIGDSISQPMFFSVNAVTGAKIMLTELVYID